MAFAVLPGQLERRAELYQQLAVSLAAGLPLPRAVRLLAAHPVSASFRAPLLRVADRLDAGDLFAEALGRLGAWMPEFDRAMIAAGEQSGRLDDALRLLARSCRERAASLRATLNGLIYPAAVFHVMVLIVPVGRLTRAVWEGEWAAFFLQKLAVLGPLYALGAGVLWLTRDARGRAVRSLLERVFAAVPLLGGAQRALNLSRLSLALHGLLNAGVPALRAWPLAAAASGSPGLERVITTWRSALEAGATPAELVLESGAFPAQFASLYHTGEVSGRIDEVLPRLAVHYQEEGERKLRQAAAGFTGLVYASVVLLAAWQIVSFWSGYYGAILSIGE